MECPLNYSEALIWPEGVPTLQSKSTLECSLSLFFPYSMVIHHDCSWHFHFIQCVPSLLPSFQEPFQECISTISQGPRQGIITHILGEYIHINKLQFNQPCILFSLTSNPQDPVPYIFPLPNRMYWPNSAAPSEYNSSLPLADPAQAQSQTLVLGLVSGKVQVNSVF